MYSIVALYEWISQVVDAEFLKPFKRPIVEVQIVWIAARDKISSKYVDGASVSGRLRLHKSRVQPQHTERRTPTSPRLYSPHVHTCPLSQSLLVVLYDLMNPLLQQDARVHLMGNPGLQTQNRPGIQL